MMSPKVVLGDARIQAVEDSYNTGGPFNLGFDCGSKYGISYADARILPGFPKDHSGSDEWFRGYGAGVFLKQKGFVIVKGKVTNESVLEPAPEPILPEAPEDPYSASEPGQDSEVQSGEETPSTAPETPQEG